MENPAPADPRIEDLAFLSDADGAAMVAPDGTVVWCCMPRVDAPSVLGRLLDPRAGHLSFRPPGPVTVERRYLPGTLVLETTMRNGHGTVRLTDALALGDDPDPDAFGRAVPHALVRVMECLAGEVDVMAGFAPRPEYGAVVPDVRARPGGVDVRWPGGRLRLDTDVPLEVDGPTARGTIRLGPGGRAAMVLSADPGGAPPPAAGEALGRTVRAWRAWVARHEDHDGPRSDAVRRSVCVLRGLTHAPTGALVAAPTTSLPEVPGGGANWDYRYGWLRDASLTVRALDATGCGREARAYVDWMRRVAGDAPEGGRLQVVFGLDGARDLTERTLDHLAGYRGNRPVRVGNAAWRQRQLDVPGEVLDAAHLLGPPEGGYDPDMRAFLRGLADRAAREHVLPDSGIWEGREGERHYTVSKVMCWVALDRAIRMAPALGAGDAVPRWARAREAVRRAVLTDGWHAGRGAYTGAFGSDHLDAGVLLMPLVGFVPHDDPRMRRTVAVLREELATDGLVRRWTGADDDAGFLPCTFWLAETLACAGDLDDAEAVMERALGCAGDLGLLSEAASPRTGGAGGNTPLAISHVSMVNAAVALDEARRVARFPAAGRG